MPQLDSSSFISQIFWLIIVFCAFYLVIAKSFFPNISNILQTRKSKMLQDLQEAKDCNNQAALIKNECQQLLAKAKEDARAMIIEAEHHISLNLEQQLHELDQQLFVKTKEQTLKLELLKDQIISEIKPLEQKIVAAVLAKISKA